jgi:hypothetical protein
MNTLITFLMAGILMPVGLPNSINEAATQRCQPGKDCRPVCQTLEQKNCKPNPKKPKQPGNQKPTFVPKDNGGPNSNHGTGTR